MLSRPEKYRGADTFEVTRKIEAAMEQPGAPAGIDTTIFQPAFIGIDRQPHHICLGILLVILIIIALLLGLSIRRS